MEIQEGWLVKKNQNRYFILKGTVLYWFTSKQSPNSDLSATARSSLNLGSCTMGVADKPQTIKIVAPLEVYVLKGRTNEEVSTWYTAIDNAINFAKNISTSTKSGYMEKKNKKRFFILRGGTLHWYLNEQQGKPKGCLDLKGCSVGPVTDTTSSFVISVPYLNNKQYKLTCLNGLPEAQEWAKAIRDAIDVNKQEEKANRNTYPLDDTDIKKEGWLDKKGKKRYFKLINNNLTWYDQDPKIKTVEMNGTLNLKGCQVAQMEFHFTIKPLVGKCYTLKGTSEEEVTEWVQSVIAASSKVLTNEAQKVNMYDISKREGWVIKKGVGKVAGQKRRQLRRYIRIDTQSATLKYYDTDIVDGVTPRGSIHLAGCRASAFDEKTFMVLTGHGRDYPFECKDSEEVTQWVKSIQYYINKADTEMEKAIIKHQWLMGGRAQGDRWVVITKNHLLMWFMQVTPPNEITQANANGWMDITYTRVEPHTEIQNVFIVLQPRAQPISFTCPDVSSFKSWMSAFQSIAAGGDGKGTIESRVFGRSLLDLIKDEGGRIPRLVVNCAEYIRKHGTDVKGIFRLSGQSDEIQTYTKSFDNDEVVQFTPETDVNAVAGVLKSFFREMPEPAVPFHLYQQFITIDDLEAAKKVVKALPKPNYDLMNYLCHFLAEMAQYVEATSMNFENIAIVFAPNLLRRKDPDSISGLTDTPKVLKSFQFVIENYKKLWEEGPPPIDSPNDTFGLSKNSPRSTEDPGELYLSELPLSCSSPDLSFPVSDRPPNTTSSARNGNPSQAKRKKHRSFGTPKRNSVLNALTPPKKNSTTNLSQYVLNPVPAEVEVSGSLTTSGGNRKKHKSSGVPKRERTSARRREFPETIPDVPGEEMEDKPIKKEENKEVDLTQPNDGKKTEESILKSPRKRNLENKD